MPRLNAFTVTIKTGENGLDDPPSFKINGHSMALEADSGGCGAGETFVGGFSPRSFAHSLVLEGPKMGKWDLERVEITFDCDGDAPYTCVFAPIALDANSELNIWQDKPLPTFDV